VKNNDANNGFNEQPGNFGLPGNYFQKSAYSILNKIEWQEEHKDFPKLNTHKNKNGFIVPASYFSKNELQLELMQYPNLISLKNVNAFRVPENYFEGRETAELSKVLNESANDLQSFHILGSIKKENNFTVSQDYFSKNGLRLINLLEPGKRARVIHLFSRRIGYAVAAMLLIAIGIWIYNFYFAPVQMKDCGTIACVDKQDLVKTKNLESLDNEELYELVNPKELEKKLEIKEDKNVKKDLKDSSLKSIPTDDLLDEI
jgi:hypothetical protein